MSFKVVCSKCGETKGFSKERYLKNVRNYGSEENLQNNYVCRKCRNQDYTAGPTPKLQSQMDLLVLASKVLPNITNTKLKKRLEKLIKEVERDIVKK